MPSFSNNTTYVIKRITGLHGRPQCRVHKYPIKAWCRMGEIRNHDTVTADQLIERIKTNYGTDYHWCRRCFKNGVSDLVY